MGGVRLFTIADVARLPDELPSGPVRWELDNGRLIAMPPPGDIHGAVQCNMGTYLKMQGEFRGLGKARTEVTVVLWRNPDRLVIPDAMFITNALLPLRYSTEGYLETIPELTIEVRSKNDTWAEIRRKVADYQAAGVRVIWVPDQEARTVTEFRANQPDRVYVETDTLTIDDVIPGFSLPVRDALQT
jgi:Uma2 family endonuclease